MNEMLLYLDKNCEAQSPCTSPEKAFSFSFDLDVFAYAYFENEWGMVHSFRLLGVEFSKTKMKVK